MEIIGSLVIALKAVNEKSMPVLVSGITHRGIGKDVKRMLSRYSINVVEVSTEPYKPHPERPDQVHNSVPEEELSLLYFYVNKNQAQEAERLMMLSGVLCYGFPKYNKQEYRSSRKNMPMPQSGRGGGTGYGRGRPKSQATKDKEKRELERQKELKILEDGRKKKKRNDKIKKVKKFLLT